MKYKRYSYLDQTKKEEVPESHILIRTTTKKRVREIASLVRVGMIPMVFGVES